MTFLAILLVTILMKIEETLLCRDIFKKSLLGDMDIMVINVDGNFKIPYLIEFDKVGFEEEISKRPILSMRDWTSFDAHCPVILRNINFLQIWFSIKVPCVLEWVK